MAVTTQYMVPAKAIRPVSQPSQKARRGAAPSRARWSGSKTTRPANPGRSRESREDRGCRSRRRERSDAGAIRASQATISERRTTCKLAVFGAVAYDSPHEARVLDRYRVPDPVERQPGAG